MIDKKEKNWIIKFSVVAIAITSIPYLLGYLRAGEEWRFSGFVINLEDGNSYIAKMLRGADGDWLFRTPYSAYPQQGFFSFLPYLLLGKLISPPSMHEQAIALFHLFRISGIFFLVYSIYTFLSSFLTEINLRKFATGLVVFGGGVGWLSLIGISSLWNGRIPVEFYSPEAFGFLMIFDLPHLCFARGFLLLALRECIFLDSHSSAIVIIKKGILWVMIGVFQPLMIISGWLIVTAVWITFIFTKIKKMSTSRAQFFSVGSLFRNSLIMLVFTVPFVAYNFLSFQFDPYLKSWLYQNILISPPISDYFLAYIVYLPLALYGIFYLSRKNISLALFISITIVLLIAAAYIPYSVQRRLIEGAFIFIIIATMVGISYLNKKVTRIIMLLSGINFITTLIIIIGTVISAWNPREPVFIDREKANLFERLNVIGAKNKVILSSYSNSNQIPAWVPMFTLIGHGPESANLEELGGDIIDFFDTGTPDNFRNSLIRDFNIQYIFYGPEEKQIGDWSPKNVTGFSLLAENGPYEIYQVSK